MTIPRPRGRDNRRREERGRGWAYTGALLGGILSIAANVAHSYVPPVDASTGWKPQPGAVFSSIAWPIVLFFAVEILARVRWPQGRWWAALRFGGFLPIAVVAGFVSYRHLSGLLVFYGEDTLTAYIGPIAIDGLMVMATGAIIVTGRTTNTITDTETAEIAGSATTPAPTPAATTPTVVGSPSLPAHLLPSARFAANRHAHATGQPITADELASAINIPADTARQLLPALGVQLPATAHVGTVNGTPVGAP